MTEKTDKRAAAYRVGLERGRAIMTGMSGSTRNVEPGGEHHRKLAKATAAYIGIDGEALTQEVVAFHRERLDRAPDPAKYPEASDALDVLLEKHRGMAEAGMDDTLIALDESLGFWQKHVMVHKHGKPANPVAINALRERCRVVYMPDSDQGPVHYKNVDDPLESWTPKPPEPQGQLWPNSPLFFDGTGSGLHIDEPPTEIFPLDVKSLAIEHCTTVDEAEQFLVRYQYFYEGGNLLVHDDKGNSVAVDSASRNRIAVRKPDSSGINYINGMSSFDDDYEAFMNSQRKKYLDLTGQTYEGVEGCYFRTCEGVRRNMQRYMDELKKTPTLAKLHEVMCARDPDGSMCKSAKKVHPDEVNPGATLMQRLFFTASRIGFIRQWRGDVPVWEAQWQMVQYV